jgi:cbb3-type cytochrome oxidase subunit 1
MEVRAVPYGRPTVAINITFLSIAWIAVNLRIYTRLSIMKKFYLEDWFLVSALVCVALYHCFVRLVLKAWTQVLYSVFCGTVIALAKVTELGEGQNLTFGRVLLATKVWHIMASHCI